MPYLNTTTHFWECSLFSIFHVFLFFSKLLKYLGFIHSSCVHVHTFVQYERRLLDMFEHDRIDTIC